MKDTKDNPEVVLESTDLLCPRPIYVEYYSHESADCYKIDLPWTKYRKDTRVLCTVNEGLEKAKKLAENVILEHLQECFSQA